MIKVQTHLPPLPIAVTNGAAGQNGSRLFAGLGSAGQTWMSLDLEQPGAGWVPLAPLPDVPPHQPAYGMVGGRIFVLGGSIWDRRLGNMRQSKRIWAYDISQDQWHCRSFEQHDDFLGAVAVNSDDKGLILVGGYNRTQFDHFCSSMNTSEFNDQEAFREQYMTRDVACYEWSKQLRRFDAETATLEIVAENPIFASCGSALLKMDRRAWCISGEIKPGLRRNNIVQFDNATYEILAIEPVNGGLVFSHGDGVASCFAGILHKTPLFAGGTYFLGAGKEYREGRLFAHRGLARHWSDECFIRTEDDGWQLVGHLPASRAHGFSFGTPDGILLVGGDSQDGKPVVDNWLLSDISVS